jgi:hypothetical protein
MTYLEEDGGVNGIDLVAIGFGRDQRCGGEESAKQCRTDDHNG